MATIVKLTEMLTGDTCYLNLNIKIRIALLKVKTILPTS